MTKIRLAVVCDFREENWPSMDLVADMLVSQLESNYSDLFAVTRVCPRMRRRFSSNSTSIGAAFNADRLLNRFWDYPRYLRELRENFDLFHLVDHSYGQLLHELPAARTIVTCHDLDTFQCLLNPAKDPRSFPFRKMMARTLSGFRKAARVACDSQATRDELLAYQLVAPERAIVIPNGVHPACSPEPSSAAELEAVRLLGEPRANDVALLHVGSTIPRKRIDLLLQIFAAVQRDFPHARLIRVGGDFTAEQKALADRLNVWQSLSLLPQLDRQVLAAVYGRATAVLLTSEREGFGLPVVEAMACGTPVIVSDLPVLREVGGEAAQYLPAEQSGLWSAAIASLVREKIEDPEASQARRKAAIDQAAKFSWRRYATTLTSLYENVLKDS